ncbi:uncharacterized protein LOC113513438 [Galleria mellonella]|uniref:Uncharacterized protein LOC113513438 n=1 Tax=Galleria mellonella TaxID=7137 RepID=A0A6J1WP56_GALME|nr:uncharacterized protein LOC113513438 [Galleria mellonella]
MMINILSYVGIELQSEVCLWTLLGLVRTIFDATLFKVNANLKQVWQMRMPDDLTLPVQRMLRTIISGVMLVQCFTVYVYLASYIVLMYPVFLEERPALVLPWLLLAAVRKLLCELTNLALGLGTCVLLGPARPPCIKFLIIKVASIMPAFYMWILVYSYYHALKVASVFKTFPAVLQTSDHDYGLELAIRRRRTKSLLGEEELRKKFVTNLYNERHSSNGTANQIKCDYSSRIDESTDLITEEIPIDYDILQPISTTSNRLMSDIGFYEDWFGSDVTIPRDSDRILEQFVVMLLHIAVFLKKKEDPNNVCSFNSQSLMTVPKMDNIDCANMPVDDTETPLLVGTTSQKTASYLQKYPQIFMKKYPEVSLTLQSEDKLNTKIIHNLHRKGEKNNVVKSHKHTITIESNQTTTVDIEKVISRRKINAPECLNNKKIQQKLSEKSVVFSNKSDDANPISIDLEPKFKEKILNTLNTIKQPASVLSLQIIEISSNQEIHNCFFKKSTESLSLSNSSAEKPTITRKRSLEEKNIKWNIKYHRNES